MAILMSSVLLLTVWPAAAGSLVFDTSSTKVAFNVGGGVKYEINNRIVARADLRRFQAIDIAPDYWRLYGGVTLVLKVTR